MACLTPILPSQPPELCHVRHGTPWKTSRVHASLAKLSSSPPHNVSQDRMTTPSGCQRINLATEAGVSNTPSIENSLSKATLIMGMATVMETTRHLVVFPFS